jgi:hypothetical protein
MAEPARAVSLLFQPGEVPAASDGFADVLARHLTGHRLRPGQRLALPGWPRMTVEDVEPPGGVVREGTRVEITVPPSLGEGPMHLAFLVDASLTMGEGSPSAYDRAAALIDAFMMNGRSFLDSTGIVVQGGETRHVEERDSPEAMSGALIHRVEPKGTFDLEAGLQRAPEVLADAPEGPRAILLVTDGDVALADPIGAASTVAREGARLFAVAEEPTAALADACRHTGGRADRSPEAVFAALADVVGAHASWSPPASPEETATDAEFETVIESMEEPR